jgi:WD40 repeat protein
MNTITHPKAVRRLVILVALTAIVSLLYGIQYYFGGPLRLSMTSEIHDLALSRNGFLVAAGAQDGTVRLWEIPRNRDARVREDWPMRELSGHTGQPVAMERVGCGMWTAVRSNRCWKRRGARR